MKKKWIVMLAALSVFSLGVGEISMAETVEKSQVVVRGSKKPVVRSGVRKTVTTAKTASSVDNTEATETKAATKATTRRTITRTKAKNTAAGPSVEVGLLSSSEVTLTGLADFRVESDGKVIATYKSGSKLSIKKSRNNLVVNGKKAGAKVSFKAGSTGAAFSAKGNRYRGDMKAIASSSGVTLVNEVSMEDYLKGVVPCEIVSSWKSDAIKAQAVAARTYAMFHKDGYRSAGYDVTDDTRSQVYRGASAETEATNRAVVATAGEVVTYNGKPIDAVFHASGGGYTENCENVWGTVVPYLKGVQEEKYAEQWTETGTLTSFANLAGVGKLKNIKLTKLRIGEAHKSKDRGVSGRVKTITVVGSKGTKTLTGDTLQSAFGLNSTLFDISIKGKNIIFTGYGYGHGLGLSQWGAQAMAEKHGDGKDYYKQILTHYFSGTKVEKVY